MHGVVYLTNRFPSPVSEPLAAQYAKWNKWEWNLARPIDNNSTFIFFKNIRSSAAGWGGIPYAGYKLVGVGYGKHF